MFALPANSGGKKISTRTRKWYPFPHNCRKADAILCPETTDVVPHESLAKLPDSQAVAPS